MKKRKKLFCLIIFILILFVTFFFESNIVKIKTHKYITNKTKSFTICHLSDIHSHSNHYQFNTLTVDIKKINPDIIFISGDLIDKNASSLDSTKNILDHLIQYPIFYVNGNHEVQSKIYDKLLELFLEYENITFLNNDYQTISINNSNVNIIGLSDPLFSQIETTAYLESIFKEIDNDYLNILLSHRPELLSVYAKYNVELCFSGHTHGGQVALFNKSLYVPTQGFFPKYSSGVYKENKTTMYLSRGLSECSFKFRLFASKEILVVKINEKTHGF